MKVKGIDHIVIPVTDIEKSLYFYTDVLGMEPDRANNRFAVKFGSQKINLHVGLAEFLPAACNPSYGSADICLIVEGSLADVKGEIEAKGWPIELGPVRRTGAVGGIDSLYLRDPDENLVEISTYSELLLK